MTDTERHISRQTRLLLQLLGPIGFDETERHVGSVDPNDGIVEHAGLGIWVHADPDMIRLIVEESEGDPGYRLTLGRRDLGISQSLQIIAVHARAAVEERLR